jgi:lipopolysaccharide/colanic/teichoic acid biosynthesis glycosyltransferase
MTATLIDECTPSRHAQMVGHSLLPSERESSPDPLMSHQPGAWSQSKAKRCFDVIAVLLSLPLALPILIAIAIAVRLNSHGAALFVQTRVGTGGTTFTIFKFRTMVNDSGMARPSVTTIGNQHFTSIGPFLRKWKLDELPQLLNVLRGDMSLVGPRPKMSEHQSGLLLCRPGITGAATLAFAREEFLLAEVPKADLDAFVCRVVNPLKSQMDNEYMARATFVSDLKLIVRSVFRKGSNKGSESVASGPVLGPGHKSFLEAIDALAQQ